MPTLLYNPSQIVTVNSGGNLYKRGIDMNNIAAFDNHSIEIADGKIGRLLPSSSVNPEQYDKVIDLTGKTILPGLVECHTHTVFSGSRSNEFRLKLAGVPYEEIAQKGGGINSTVKAVRDSSFDELYNASAPRVEYFIEQGVTTLEIKSGYGLSFYDEIKLLQVIEQLNKNYKIDIIPTFLGAHTFPKEFAGDHSKYLDIIINEMIPFIAEKNIAQFCDAFCEKTAFSAAQIEKIFLIAEKSGMKLKLHTEQFNSIGGLETALKHNAVSVDHLEVAGTKEIDLLKDSETVSVLLPGVSFFLRYGYAPARGLIDENAIVALATDYNPGSSHIANVNFIMSLAAFNLNMTIEEIISAYTINSAYALRKSDTTGSIETGKCADFAIYNCTDYSDIIYNVGTNLITHTIKNGEVIYSKD